MDILELGKTPIPGDSPTGADSKYEPEFEELQAEIDKLSVASLEATPVNWEQVVSLATTLLSEKTKDLLVAAYLAEGLVRNEQFTGLCKGTRILRDLVENYWDNLFPAKKRMRGRLNAFSWWLERSEAFLEGFETEPLPAEDVEGLKENLSTLDSQLGEKVDEAPIISKLSNLVDRLPVAEPEPEPEPEPGTEAAEGAEGSAPDQGAPAPAKPVAKPAASARAVPTAPDASAVGGSEKDLLKAVEDGLDHLARLGGMLGDANDASALPFRLLRIASWLTVDAPPPAESGQTMLPPPDPSVKATLDSLMAGKDYPEVVKSAESRVREYLFWLDLSRYTALALEKLGGKYESALEAVCQETALYAARLPGLAGLSFSDGTPFADAETRAWLKSIALGGGDADDGAPGGGDPESDAAAEAYAQAQKLLKDKKSVEAAALLNDGLRRAGSIRGRLAWRITLARFLLLTGKSDALLPQLDAIMEELEAYKLEEYDPDLALAGLKAAREGYSGLDDDEARALAGKCLARIARLNPAEAMKIIDKA